MAAQAAMLISNVGRRLTKACCFARCERILLGADQADPTASDVQVELAEQ